MKDTILARRYALAALQCLNKAEYQKASEQTFALRKHFKANPEHVKYLSASVINKQHKQEFIAAIVTELKLEYLDFWQRTFAVLIAKHRCNLIETFLKALDILLIEALDQRHIDLILAHEQPKELVDMIDSEVERILGSKTISDVTIDKGIIGGFIAITKNQIIDASVRTQLRNFSLKKVSSLPRSGIPPAVTAVTTQK